MSGCRSSAKRAIQPKLLPAFLAVLLTWPAALAAVLPLVAVAQAEDKTLVEWKFDKDGDFRDWKPFGMIADAIVRGGSLSGKPTGSDPILMGPVFEISASPSQYVEVCLKTAAGGPVELYWTETLEGRFGGFDAAKQRVFPTQGDNQFYVYRIWPFWHAAQKVIRLRLDPPSAGPFEIQSIRIAEQPAADAADTRIWQREELRKTWQACGDVASGPQGPIFLSPAISVPADECGFVCVRMATRSAGSGRLFCVSSTQYGWESVSFPLRPDGAMHSYNVQVGALENWRDKIVRLGLQVPTDKQAETRIESIEIAREPAGPAELQIAYFGPTEGINRAGRPVSVACTLRNLGGQTAEKVKVLLQAPPDVKLLDENPQSIDRLSLYLPKTITWRIQAAEAGRLDLSIKSFAPKTIAVEGTASVELTPSLNLPKADYVPEPKPVRSKYDIGAFYFPGWATSDRWQPIRNYPNRKPILGWYDEANPECADWQIKWAVEHGVKFFMVDWYWSQGNRHLEHWVHNAYAKAKYRKYLNWAIMWANHNPPNTHSADDWRKVTQYWIDHYFAMPEYYRIDGRPAVFIWSPHSIRQDLGGSKEAAALYAMSQEMAKAAGYPGIYFVAMGAPGTPEGGKQLAGEGFEGVTMYHGFELARQRAGSDHFPYASLLETCPELWRRTDERAGGLLHLPIVDTGWDARPWHGDKSMVAYGRTPELFGKLCRLARQHADASGKRIIAIGPWNEWGEGSYIEPYAEYGFQDLDQLRAALCEPGDWPPNLIPSDVGLGPYDLPEPRIRDKWEFNSDPEGWTSSGQIADLRVRDGLLVGRSSGNDPLLQVGGLQIEADPAHRLVVRMRSDARQRVQIFWATTLTKMSEQASRTFEIAGGGQLHDYQIDLGSHPHWRGIVTELRIDPATQPGVQFAIDSIRLEKK